VGSRDLAKYKNILLRSAATACSFLKRWRFCRYLRAIYRAVCNI